MNQTSLEEAVKNISISGNENTGNSATATASSEQQQIAQEEEYEALGLGELHGEGFRLHKQILKEEEEEGKVKDETIVKKCLHYLQKANVLMRRVGIFSPQNEGLDDVNTGDLRFFLVPALLSDVVLKVKFTGPCSMASDDYVRFRFQQISASKQYVMQFMELCNAYGLVEELDWKIYNHYVDSSPANQHCDSDESRSSQKPSPGQGLSGEERRQAKIAAYRKEQQLKEALALNQQKIEVLSKNQDDSGNSNNCGGPDEELLRESGILSVGLWIRQCLESMSSLIMEEEMLIFRLKQIHTQGSANGRGEQGKAAANRDALEGKQTRRPPPFKTFTITKDDIKKNIYGAGYPSLPTMTVEEWGEMQMAQGNFIQGTGEKEIDSDCGSADSDHEDNLNEEKYEAKIKKDREWDDWKDTHRRGWGNRIGMG
eukprot:Nk52_evm1s1869 gene=Nk52_evmTU1s1869